MKPRRKRIIMKAKRDAQKAANGNGHAHVREPDEVLEPLTFDSAPVLSQQLGTAGKLPEYRNWLHKAMSETFDEIQAQGGRIVKAMRAEADFLTTAADAAEEQCRDTLNYHKTSGA